MKLFKPHTRQQTQSILREFPEAVRKLNKFILSAVRDLSCIPVCKSKHCMLSVVA